MEEGAASRPEPSISTGSDRVVRPAKILSKTFNVIFRIYFDRNCYSLLWIPRSNIYSYLRIYSIRH